VLLIAANGVAFIHAYKLTHFTTDSTIEVTDAKQLSLRDKIKVLFTGIDSPRPVNKSLPAQPYETVKLQSNKVIECWSIKANPKGTVILFHGYKGKKSAMLDKSDEFIRLGYSTLVVDFMGSGGSEGDQTTIGFKEAEQVKTCYDYLASQGEQNIYLFGTSMGAVAILKAMDDYAIQPTGIILECPFGTMYETTCARFESLGVPVFPFASLLVFWGGIENGFWAFAHRPVEYAKSVNCPALLLYGEKDQRVSRREIDEIYQNLKGEKQLRTYPLAGHENYLTKYRRQWIADIDLFLNKHK
jgi:uncharacterized protein